MASNLYVPKHRKFPLPGVVGTCGHSTLGKSVGIYQSFAQGLARQGYVVLIFDPIGQGERLQYPDDQQKSLVGAGVPEHLHAGNQQFLVGEFFGAWRAWDGIRALDYLLMRPEVDPKHVGVTGHSGGGTMATWLCGLDPRWTMAAPNCFVSSFLRVMENELSPDTEQCPPHVLALGLDQADFIAAMAPKPVILMGQEKDSCDARGLEQAFRWLKQLYALLGAEQNISLVVGPTYHDYSRENREAMYRWFNRATGVSDRQSEPTLALEKDETLWCAPKGQVSELGSPTVFSFTSAAAIELERPRGAPTGSKLRSSLRKILRLPELNGVPEYRILRPFRARGYPKEHVANYMVATEPGIHALVYRLSDQVHYSRPPQGPTRALLYVSHQSSDAELRTEPLVREQQGAEPNSEFYACDVRGIGESRPSINDYRYAIYSFMLDAPYVGQRTHDVLQVVAWLESFGIREIHLVAKGWGALPATFAALLADSVVKVTLKNALTAYSDIATSRDYTWPLSAFLPGVLREFDLPDCYRALAAKRFVSSILGMLRANRRKPESPGLSAEKTRQLNGSIPSLG